MRSNHTLTSLVAKLLLFWDMNICLSLHCPLLCCSQLVGLEWDTEGWIPAVPAGVSVSVRSSDAVPSTQTCDSWQAVPSCGPSVLLLLVLLVNYGAAAEQEQACAQVAGKARGILSGLCQEQCGQQDQDTDCPLHLALVRPS